jgi:putative ABC transport system substrate-binding protein
VRRREFIALVGGATVAWPLPARAQQPALPVIAFFSGRSTDASVRVASAFREGLNETGYVEGQNVTVESNTETTLHIVQEAAHTLGLQIEIVNATTISEIDSAFAGFTRERPDALFVAPDGFFVSRAVQFATLTARDKIPAAYPERDMAAAGGLMSYGTDASDMYRQVGVYTGSVLKGAKPADMPVLQSTKFEFVINLQTARALGIEVPSGLLSIADDVIE